MRKLYLLLAFGMFFGKFHAQENLSFSLNEAIDYALENAFSAINAGRDISIAEEEKRKTKAMGLPQINAEGNYRQYLRVPLSLVPSEIFGGTPGQFEEVFLGTKHNASGIATLEQLIFDGSYLIALQSSKVYMQISKNAKEKNRQKIRETIINAYGNVLMSEESINILYNNQESLSKTLEETIQIFNNGLTEEEDVEQLQITLASVNSNLARTKRQYTIAKQLLNLAMGIDINRNIVLSEKLENLASKFVQFGSITAGFNVEKHIDYKIAKNTERGKELLMKLEESRKLPTLNGFLNYGINGFSDSFDFFNTDKKWFSFSQVGLNLKIPIFSGFARSAAIEKSKIELSKYRTDLFELEQKLKLNVATAKTDYNFFISELSNALKNLALAERIEKKQQIKYFEGISSSFEFSEAQRQLYTMQQNYLKSLFEVISSKAKLDSALNEPIDNKK